MTFLTCDSSVPTSVAICATGIRVPDAQQINARSRLTSEAALRDNRLSRLPSSGSNSRTNTDGGRIHTSKSGMRPGSTPTSRFRSIDTRRSTSIPAVRRILLVLGLVLAPAAEAAPFAVGTGQNGGIAVDDGGTAYVGWQVNVYDPGD